MKTKVNNPGMEALLKVRGHLMTLQRELLETIKDIFEKENGRAVAPGEWLQVLMVSHRYEWLRELTSLITDIDIFSELQPVPEDQISIIKAEVERLFFKADSTSEFNKQYRLLMSTNAPFIMTQGLLKEATQKLPSAKEVDAAAARLAWHEEHKNQSRLRRS